MLNYIPNLYQAIKNAGIRRLAAEGIPGNTIPVFPEGSSIVSRDEIIGGD